MIGQLPKELNVNGQDLAIRSDFRVALLIFQAYSDPDLTDQEKCMVMLECLFEDSKLISEESMEEALKMAAWFLDGGGTTSGELNHNQDKKVMDWEQDEQLIFSSVNKVAGYETRATEYLHWWTFLGFFNEIGEGLFTTIINIRNKKNKHKKLDKAELEYYKNNKSLIDLKRKYTAEEKADMDNLNQLLDS
jgi:hypothetical protein